MKGNKQSARSLTRKTKIKKDGLSGWCHEEDFPLQDENGIDTWLEDRKQSGRERGYVCALVESFYRQEKARLLKSRNSSSRKSQRRQQSCKVTRNDSRTEKAECNDVDDDINQSSLPQKTIIIPSSGDTDPSSSDTIGSFSDHVTLNSSSDAIGSSSDHLTFNQSDHFHSLPKDEIDLNREFRCHYNNYDSIGSQQRVETPPENLPIVNLTCYEERLRKQRENRLKKSIDIIKKTDTTIVCSSSPKKVAYITSVTYAEGMIKPIINGMDVSARKTTFNNSKLKLPSLSTELQQNASNIERKSQIASTKVGHHVYVPKVDSESVSKHTIKDKNIRKKLDFDILEKYASIRNSKGTRSKASFRDYVDKVRNLRYGENADGDIFCTDEQRLDEMKAAGRALGEVYGARPTFEHVRELWHKSQRENMLNKVTRRTRSFPPRTNGKMMMIDMKRSQCISEPCNIGDKNMSSLPFYKCKQPPKCPLKRMISATNRRLEANKLHGSNENSSQNMKSETIEIVRTEIGIHCCILRRSTPCNNQSAALP